MPKIGIGTCTRVQGADHWQNQTTDPAMPDFNGAGPSYYWRVVVAIAVLVP